MAPAIDPEEDNDPQRRAEQRGRMGCMGSGSDSSTVVQGRGARGVQGGARRRYYGTSQLGSLLSLGLSSISMACVF